MNITVRHYYNTEDVEPPSNRHLLRGPRELPAVFWIDFRFQAL